MSYSFEFGEAGEHAVNFHFNPIRGGLKIDVDGHSLSDGRELRVRKMGRVERYEFKVGDDPHYHVTIDHELRGSLHAEIQKRRYKVFVDGVHIADHEGG